MNMRLIRAIAVGLTTALVGLSGVLLVNTSASATSAITLFTLDGDGDLFSINPNDATVTLVGPSGVNTQNHGYVIGAGFSTSDTSTYVLTDDCSVFKITTSTPLTSQQVGTLTGTVGGVVIYGCTAGAIDDSGNFWVSVLGGNINSPTFGMAKFSLTSTATTVFSTTHSTFYTSLWFDPSDGQLWGADDALGRLFTFDDVNGVATDTNVLLPSYSYGVVLDSSGVFYLNESRDLFTGSSTNYGSWSHVGQYGNPLPQGTKNLFTSTDFWPSSSTQSSPTQNQDSPATNEVSLANTGTKESSWLVWAGFLMLTGISALLINKRIETKSS